MGLFDTIKNLFDLDLSEQNNHFCKTPQLMEYIAKFSMKSDEELEKLAKSKDKIKTAAAKHVLKQRGRNAERAE